MHRVLALVYAVPGIGWAISTVAVLIYHQQQGVLPVVFGLRMIGGPYSAITTDRLTPLGWALALLLISVSAIDVLIGRWLWRETPRGARVALAMAPVSLALGWVFALPYLLVMAPLRAIAVVASRRRDRAQTADQ